MTEVNTLSCSRCRWPLAVVEALPANHDRAAVARLGCRRCDTPGPMICVRLGHRQPIEDRSTLAGLRRALESAD